MTPTEGHAALAAARRAEFEEAAAHYRRQRAVRAATRGPSPLLRAYTRLWWASRPRVDAWGRAPARADGAPA
jgi:DNA-nicking Smr family endonuclease